MSLRERLRARIERDGPLDFAEFMRAALLEPEDGFYARGARLGRGGSFATVPTRHPALAAAVAAEAAAFGAPVLVEVGPGDGSLAAELARRRASERLVLVEPAAGMRTLQQAALECAALPVEWVARPEDVCAPAAFVVANEVFDDLPRRLLAWPDEVLVGWDGDGFVEVLRPAPPGLRAALADAGSEPRAGARYAVSPEAPALLERLAAIAARARLLVVDYGGEGPEAHRGIDPIRTYVGGVRGGEPLQAPGRQNLTADVDFAQLRRAARELGLRELRYGTQGEWLREHGVSTPPPAARSADDWLLAALLDDVAFKVLLLERAPDGSS